MASDGAGGAFVAWVDLRNQETYFDIYLQHITASGTIASGWPVDGIPVCTAPLYQLVPLVAPDGAGGAFVVWEDHRRGGASYQIDIYAQRITAEGTIAVGWPVDGMPVCTAPGERVGVMIASDGVGGVFITCQMVAPSKSLDTMFTHSASPDRGPLRRVGRWTVYGCAPLQAIRASSGSSATGPMGSSSHGSMTAQLRLAYPVPIPTSTSMSSA